MNYQKIYDNLISTRQDRNLNANTFYENHHIIMKSMGGSNLPENLLKLTPREHYLAHLLLWKIHRNRETASAFWFMNINGRYSSHYSSRFYEESRKENSKILSEKTTEMNIRKWNSLTEDQRKEKMETLRSFRSENFHSKGKWSSKTKQDFSDIVIKGWRNRKFPHRVTCSCNHILQGYSLGSITSKMKKHQQFCENFIEGLEEKFPCSCGAIFPSKGSRHVHSQQCRKIKEIS